MAERRTALCTVGVGPHEELLRHSLPSFERYALRHGHDLVARSDVADICDRPPAWACIPLVHQLLGSYEAVIWVDADAIIVDPTEDLVRVAPPRSLSLVFHRIDDVVIPNTGVFVARRSRRTLRLLERVWHADVEMDHRWWENAALLSVLGGDPDVGLRTMTELRRARRLVGELALGWNSIPACPDPEPAIVHLAGVPFDDRVRQLAALASAVDPAAQR